MMMPDSAPRETAREKLLRAALHLFVTQGFHATPTAQISREAGVSTGLLFHHFGDKETLVNELYLSIKKEMAEAMRAGDDEGLPAGKRITAILRTFILWGISHPEERAFLDLFYHSPNICEEVKEQAYMDFVWIGEVYAGAVEQGIVADLPHPLASAIVLQVAGAIIDVAGAGCPGLTTEEVVDAGLGVLWHGIGGASTRPDPGPDAPNHRVLPP
ncbi:TetR/AcrR family transcriptional regulator [Methanofollis fontis]|uniref:HTH tetR-type domain-containing protein n=1 Tax=Methanofollis fontis TaxID=2052832 RepID=A0A483CYW1_9EURY|nr:TetR/AcrR family transcriptional regulator [Methanofollis fontis]TAJ44986.1 hypothetical protein CUJ86_06830 [Methanofollis fontis]